MQQDWNNMRGSWQEAVTTLNQIIIFSSCRRVTTETGKYVNYNTCAVLLMEIRGRWRRQTAALSCCESIWTESNAGLTISPVVWYFCVNRQH